MRSEELKIVFKLESFSVEIALQGIQSVLAKHKVPFTGFMLNGRPVNLREALVQLERSRKRTFDLVGQGFEFLLGCVRNFQLDFLRIKSEAEPKVAWNEWAAQFIGSPDFVMAWLADSDYQHWQNAEDTLEFTAVGKSYAHLPMKSNGLPPPLNQQIIDISCNPGRWSLRTGYYEAVGAVMWLGERFWQLTSADRIQIASSRWLRVSNPLPTVIRLQASDLCFTTAEGASGELQSKLRLFLFPDRAISR